MIIVNIRCAIYVRVSTDDQRDNGYSIDSQLRMIKEYCEKNDYCIIDVYNDAGHSGKDLMRPEMQRLLADIKAKKIDKLIAIKVDRLTRNNFDGFWLLNYCEEHEVKIELILEPYDVSTANGEMIFGMNLVFGQRERKEIGARTKRAMEEMALERVHPSKAPYGYIRDKITGHLEVEPIEAQVVKEIFELCKKGNSVRGIATIMKDTNRYLKTGKWKSDRVYKILTNSIYIGTFAFGKYKRKEQDILYVENYCEPIIDLNTWNSTRNVLIKNKHSNYGDYIHLFSGLVKCPICGEIMSSSESFKYPNGKQKVYYHLRCKNHNCKGFGLHYNTEKIETKLKRILEELTIYMLSMNNEIIISNSTKNKDIKEIEKAIEKLKLQEKKLVDLYLSSTLNVESINHKNDTIKKEIEKLNKKKSTLDPDNNSKEYTTELIKKLDCTEENDKLIFTNIKMIGFTFFYDLLSRKSKRDMIHRLISSIEITRDTNYNIDIKNIKFTDEFITKSSKAYLKYLNEIMINNNVGIRYKDEIDKEKLKNMELDYDILSLNKMNNNKYSNEFLEKFIANAKEHLYADGIISCPYVEENKLKDILILVPKNDIAMANQIKKWRDEK
jgi:site-specific DNA recombinase